MLLRKDQIARIESWKYARWFSKFPIYAFAWSYFCIKIQDFCKQNFAFYIFVYVDEHLEYEACKRFFILMTLMPSIYVVDTIKSILMMHSCQRKTSHDIRRWHHFVLCHKSAITCLCSKSRTQFSCADLCMLLVRIVGCACFEHHHLAMM